MTAQRILSALPPEALQRLQTAQVDAGQLDRLLGWPASDGVLFVGSVANGLATSASDLDFIVLRDATDPINRVAGERGLVVNEVFVSTFIDRILTQLDGVELDIWLVSKAKASSLAEVLAAAVDNDGSIRSLPGLQYLEAKFLASVYRGTVVQGDETVARWREWLRIEHLPALRTANLMVEALSYLEDAASIGSGRERGGLGSTLGSVIAARSAAERVVHAAFTSAGIIGWDLRYAELHRNELRERGERVPAAVAALEELLFPSLPAVGRAPDGAAGYTRLVLEHAAELFDELRQRPAMMAVVAFLRAFGRRRWELDTSFLER